MTKKGIPDRWEKYLPVGCRVPGTRFLPFKVPLKPELCKKTPETERFTPSILLQGNPALKAVIDLTNTNRYYNCEEFTAKGVHYKKIKVFGGGKVPSEKILDEFFVAVDELCELLQHDQDALIGVHCTHGLNRTGYLICKYMVVRMKIDPEEAINKFQEARGYNIERNNYVSDIKCKEQVTHKVLSLDKTLNQEQPLAWRNDSVYKKERVTSYRQGTSASYYSDSHRRRENFGSRERRNSRFSRSSYDNWRSEPRRVPGRPEEEYRQRPNFRIEKSKYSWHRRLQRREPT